MSAVGLENVTEVFEDGTVAVENLTLDVASGELMVLLGPSGCGKSTVLRMIAGLEPATEGRITIDGADADEIPTRERGVSMVFQDFALYPHMTARENLGFPLKVQRLPADEIAVRVAAVAYQLGIAHLLDRGTRAGSRAASGSGWRWTGVIREPSVFLMDEPLSNVDSLLRSQLRAEIADMVRGIGVTTVYVTHDQVEALTMADRVAILREGVLQDLGTPDQVYTQPGTIYVAAFLGQPRINLFTVYAHVYLESRVALHLGAHAAGQVLHVPWSDPRSRMLARYHGEQVVIGARAEALIPTRPLVGYPNRAEQTLHGRVRFVEHLGHESIGYLDIGAQPVLVEDAGDTGRHHQPGAEVAVRLPAYPRLATGDTVAMQVAVDRLHFFDPKGRAGSTSAGCDPGVRHSTADGSDPTVPAVVRSYCP